MPDIVPPLTPTISLIFPATWAVDALRVVGIPGYQGLGFGLTGDLLGTLATSVLYVVISVAVFRRVEHHLLEAGTADEY